MTILTRITYQFSLDCYQWESCIGGSTAFNATIFPIGFT